MTDTVSAAQQFLDDYSTYMLEDGPTVPESVWLDRLKALPREDDPKCQHGIALSDLCQYVEDAVNLPEEKVSSTRRWLVATVDLLHNEAGAALLIETAKQVQHDLGRVAEETR
jgi:hypothetical protein